MEYGPKSGPGVNPPALVEFIDDCDDYLFRLSEFDKYCVWRYTIGSASINKYLIFHKYENDDLMDDNSYYWTYLFFLYWNTNGSKEKLPNDFIRFKLFFDQPSRFLSLKISQTKSNITRIIITNYINKLQKIILDGPIVQDDIIVYKVSSLYPGLPSLNSAFVPTLVKQDPFNSTTINKALNFEMFISPTSTSVIFKLLIPAGTKGVLYVNSDLHAYGSIEREILLPRDCSFDIINHVVNTLTYVDPTTVNLVNIQDKKKIKIGAVYEMNDFDPCKHGECLIQSKQFNVFETIYIPPN
jgi:hypothetical protein